MLPSEHWTPYLDVGRRGHWWASHEARGSNSGAVYGRLNRGRSWGFRAYHPSLQGSAPVEVPLHPGVEVVHEAKWGCRWCVVDERRREAWASSWRISSHSQPSRGLGLGQQLEDQFARNSSHGQPSAGHHFIAQWAGGRGVRAGVLSAKSPVRPCTSRGARVQSIECHFEGLRRSALLGQRGGHDEGHRHRRNQRYTTGTVTPPAGAQVGSDV